MDFDLPKLSTTKVRLNAQQNIVLKFWEKCEYGVYKLHNRVSDSRKLEQMSETSKKICIAQFYKLHVMLSHVMKLESQWAELLPTNQFPDLNNRADVEKMFKEIADIFKEKLATEYDEEDRHSIELITEGINQFLMGERKEEVL